MDTTNTTTTTDPATSDADLAPGDPRSHFAGAVTAATPIIEGVAADQYDEPTPCTSMSVRDLLEHLVMVLRRVACAGRGQPLAEWPVDAADVSEGGWLDAWRAAAHDVQAAWDDDSLARSIEVPWGTFPGAEVLAVYANEVTVHTWDLARATGQDADWDEAVLATAWRAIHSQLPMADRAPMWEAMLAQMPPEVRDEWEDPFGPAVAVSDDAPFIDRLVAWNGRTP